MRADEEARSVCTSWQDEEEMTRCRLLILTNGSSGLRVLMYYLTRTQPFGAPVQAKRGFEGMHLVAKIPPAPLGRGMSVWLADPSCPGRAFQAAASLGSCRPATLQEARAQLGGRRPERPKRRTNHRRSAPATRLRKATFLSPPRRHSAPACRRAGARGSCRCAAIAHP